MSKDPAKGNEDGKQGLTRGPKSAPGTTPAGRRERLELALRANLARRKDQARARRKNPPPARRTTSAGGPVDRDD